MDGVSVTERADLQQVNHFVDRVDLAAVVDVVLLDQGSQKRVYRPFALQGPWASVPCVTREFSVLQGQIYQRCQKVQGCYAFSKELNRRIFNICIQQIFI